MFFKWNEGNVYVLNEMHTIQIIVMVTIVGDLSPAPI